MEVEYVIVSIGIALATATVLLSSYQYYSTLTLLMFCVISLPFALLISISIKKARAMGESKERIEEFVDKMKSIEKLDGKSFSAKRILSNLYESCFDIELKKAFKSAYILSRLGYPIHMAISDATTGVARIKELLIRIPTNMDPHIFFANAIAVYEGKVQKLHADYASKLQRYSTANMFISTIVPSFAIFGFIGDLIISQKGAGLTTLVLILNFAIPLVFTISNFAMSRGLFE